MPIYKITNTQTSDFYVGKTQKTIYERFEEHKYASRYYESHLYRAFKKYGIDSFEISLIEDCDNPDLDTREIFWISQLSPSYNMTRGGEGGPTHHLQSWKDGMARRKSLAGENNPMYGKPSAMRGKSHSDEAKQIMKEKRSSFWKNKTPEQMQEIGDARRGENNYMFNKAPVNAIKCEYDGVVYRSYTYASKVTGLSINYIKKHSKKVV